MHRRSGIISAIVMMLGSSVFDMMLGMMRGVIVMNLIGPTGRGTMRLVAMIHKYLSNSHLGILHGISKELPQALGRDDQQAADEIEKVGATYVTLTAMFSGTGLILFGLLSHYGPQTRLALMAGGGILVAQQTYALYRCIIRAWGRFPVVLGGGMVNTLAEFVLFIVGAKLFGLVGTMMGWLIAEALSVLYFRFACRFYVPVSLDLKVAKRLAFSGLPIAAIIFADVLLRTADGVVIAGHYDMHRLGLYSVAMQIATYLYAIPEAGGFVMMPRILETYAANGEAARLRRQVMVPTIAAACLMPVAAGCAFILLPPMVRTVVPKFEGAVFAAQVLSMGSVFLALPVAANGLLIALNREYAVIANKVLGAAVIYGMALAQMRHDGSLRSVATAATVGYLVASLLSLIQVLGRYYHSRLQLMTQLLICHAPFVWSVGALLLSGSLMRSGLDPTVSEWWRALVRLGIFLVLMVPVLLYGETRTGLLRQLGRAFLRLGSRALRAGNGNR